MSQDRALCGRRMSWWLTWAGARPRPRTANCLRYPGETYDRQGHRAGSSKFRPRGGDAQNTNYRAVAWSGKYLQLTLMSIPVGEDIGLEAHPETDQFLRLDAGQGRVQMGRTRDRLDFDRQVGDGWAIFVPAGTWHNVTNNGEEPLQLYAIYAPVHHASARSTRRLPTRSATMTPATTSRQAGRSSLPSSRRTSTPDQRGCSSRQCRPRGRCSSDLTQRCRARVGVDDAVGLCAHPMT